MLGMPALRGLRGSVVGLSAAGLGIVGHAAAGGMLPSAPVTALATGCLVLLGIAMSSRPWDLPSLLAVLVGAQLALHVALAGGAPGHGMTGMPHQVVVPGSLMLAAHLAAAGATALLLRRGERWLLALVDLLRRPLQAVSLSLADLPRQAHPAVRHPAPVLAVTQLRHSVSRRGPPLSSLA